MTRVLIASAVLALALAGCAASPGASPLAQVPTHTIASLLPPSRSLGPDSCDKSKTVLIRSKGGTFTIPACAGWSGTFGYPPVSSGPFHFELNSSVTNNFGAPPPPSGTAIFYLQMACLGQIAPVFRNTGVTDTITSQKLIPSRSYSLYVYTLEYPYGGLIGSPAPNSDSITFVSPLNGNFFSSAIVWQFVQN